MTRCDLTVIGRDVPRGRAAAVAEALRAEASVTAAARAAGVVRTYVYKLAGLDSDVAAALRELQARGGRGRSQGARERARGALEVQAVAEQLADAAARGPAAFASAAVRLVEVARTNGLMPPVDTSRAQDPARMGGACGAAKAR